MIWIALTIIVFFIISIVLHELGHALIYYDLVNEWPDFDISFKEITVEYSEIKPKENIGVMLGGLVSGLVPLFYLMDIIAASDFISIMILGAYFFGCANDLKMILRDLKTMRKEVYK